MMCDASAKNAFTKWRSSPDLLENHGTKRKNRLIIFIEIYLLNDLLFNIYGKGTGEAWKVYPYKTLQKQKSPKMNPRFFVLLLSRV